MSLTQNVYVYFRLLVLSKGIEDVMEKDNIIDHDVCLSKVIGCYWAGNVNEQFWRLSKIILNVFIVTMASCTASDGTFNLVFFSS